MNNKKPLSNIIFSNLFYNSTARIISKLLGLVFVIFLARLLTPDLFGLYGLAFSIVSILLTFADLGINTTLIKYASSKKTTAE